MMVVVYHCWNHRDEGEAEGEAEGEMVGFLLQTMLEGEGEVDEVDEHQGEYAIYGLGCW